MARELLFSLFFYFLVVITKVCNAGLLDPDIIQLDLAKLESHLNQITNSNTIDAKDLLSTEISAIALKNYIQKLGNSGLPIDQQNSMIASVNNVMSDCRKKLSESELKNTEQKLSGMNFMGAKEIDSIKSHLMNHGSIFGNNNSSKYHALLEDWDMPSVLSLKSLSAKSLSSNLGNIVGFGIVGDSANYVRDMFDLESTKNISSLTSFLKMKDSYFSSMVKWNPEFYQNNTNQYEDIPAMFRGMIAHGAKEMWDMLSTVGAWSRNPKSMPNIIECWKQCIYLSGYLNSLQNLTNKLMIDDPNEELNKHLISKLGILSQNYLALFKNADDYKLEYHMFEDALHQFGIGLNSYTNRIVDILNKKIKVNAESSDMILPGLDKFGKNDLLKNFDLQLLDWYSNWMLVADKFQSFQLTATTFDVEDNLILAPLKDSSFHNITEAILNCDFLLDAPSLKILFISFAVNVFGFTNSLNKFKSFVNLTENYDQMPLKIIPAYMQSYLISHRNATSKVFSSLNMISTTILGERNFDLSKIITSLNDYELLLNSIREHFNDISDLLEANPFKYADEFTFLGNNGLVDFPIQQFSYPFAPQDPLAWLQNFQSAVQKVGINMQLLLNQMSELGFNRNYLLELENQTNWLSKYQILDDRHFAKFSASNLESLKEHILFSSFSDWTKDIAMAKLSNWSPTKVVSTAIESAKIREVAIFESPLFKSTMNKSSIMAFSANMDTFLNTLNEITEMSTNFKWSPLSLNNLELSCTKLGVDFQNIFQNNPDNLTLFTLNNKWLSTSGFIDDSFLSKISDTSSPWNRYWSDSISEVGHYLSQSTKDFYSYLDSSFNGEAPLESHLNGLFYLFTLSDSLDLMSKTFMEKRSLFLLSTREFLRTAIVEQEAIVQKYLSSFSQNADYNLFSINVQENVNNLGKSLSMLSTSFKPLQLNEISIDLENNSNKLNSWIPKITHQHTFFDSQHYMKLLKQPQQLINGFQFDIDQFDLINYTNTTKLEYIYNSNLVDILDYFYLLNHKVSEDKFSLEDIQSLFKTSNSVSGHLSKIKNILVENHEENNNAEFLVAQISALLFCLDASNNLALIYEQLTKEFMDRYQSGDFVTLKELLSSNGKLVSSLDSNMRVIGLGMERYGLYKILGDKENLEINDLVKSYSTFQSSSIILSNGASVDSYLNLKNVEEFKNNLRNQLCIDHLGESIDKLTKLLSLGMKTEMTPEIFSESLIQLTNINWELENIRPFDSRDEIKSMENIENWTRTYLNNNNVIKSFEKAFVDFEDPSFTSLALEKKAEKLVLWASELETTVGLLCKSLSILESQTHFGESYHKLNWRPNLTMLEKFTLTKNQPSVELNLKNPITGDSQKMNVRTVQNDLAKSKAFVDQTANLRPSGRL